MTSESAMRAALMEGRKALPHCLPNPPVGCVLVRGGEIVSRGHTGRPGEPHAEASALANLDGDLSDVSAYVTLEPCSFQGRTSSCALNLIQRQIGKVYVAIIDPDPRNSGRGIEMLWEANVIVNVGILSELAAEDLSPFLYADPERPTG